MPVSNDMALPIQPIKVSGPGLDSHEGRKERNNNDEATAAKLRANIDSVKDNLFAAVTALRQS